MKKWILIIVVLSIMGCTRQLITDPNTGETQTVMMLDPNNPTLQKAEAGAEGAVGILGAFSLLFPVLTPFAAAGAGILGTWKKVKPKLEEQTKKAEVSYKAGETLAYGLECIKTDYPDVWAKYIAPTLNRVKKPLSEVDMAIKGFRGTPNIPTDNPRLAEPTASPTNKE